MNNNRRTEVIRLGITQPRLRHQIRGEQQTVTQSVPPEAAQRTARGIAPDLRVAELSLGGLEAAWRLTEHGLMTATRPLAGNVVLGQPDVFAIPAKAES